MEKLTWLVILAASAGSGCFVDRTGTSADGMDASASPDGSVGDAGRRDDAGPPADAEPPADGGPPRDDAGPDDAGAPPIDAGPPILEVTTGLVHHYDASDPDGDGTARSFGSLSTWTTIHGSDDASCADVVYDPDGLAPGYPAVVMDGTESSQCEFSIPGFDPGDVTIAVVIRTSYARSWSDWWGSPVIVGGDKGGDHDDAAMVMDDGHVGFSRRSAGQHFLTAARYDDGVPHLFVLVRDGDTGGLSLRVDRAAPITGRADSGRINQPSKWYLASHETSGGSFAAAYAEVLVYERALDDGEAAAVTDYLLRHWNL